MQPFILPIERLPQAMCAVLESYCESKPYRNPWNGVLVQDVAPYPMSTSLITESNPLTSVPRQLQTSRNYLKWFQEAIDSSPYGLRFELNDVQPLLGDFIVMTSAGNAWLFEHKAKQFEEADDTVTFQLTWKDSRRNPFHPKRLWDFVIWQDLDTEVIYCIPRYHVPEAFCVTQATKVAIERNVVEFWRLDFDAEGAWLIHMLEKIIEPHAGEPWLREDLLQRCLTQAAAQEARSPSSLPDNESPEGDVGYEDEQKDEEEEVIHDDPDLGTTDVELASSSRTRGVRGYGLHGLMCLLQDYCAQRSVFPSAREDALLI